MCTARITLSRRLVSLRSFTRTQPASQPTPASAPLPVEAVSTRQVANAAGPAHALPPSSVRGWADAFAGLAKLRLGTLVAATTGMGYFMGGGALEAVPLISCLVGTSMAIASANSINQLYELRTDAQMRRTKDRLLPSGKLSPQFALAFGVGTGAVGTGLLCLGCNPLTAVLGFANILLYTGVYTPMKRYHPLNTWVGAVVGGIPPLMGYAAATGSLDLAAIPLFGLLYLWQIPHFLSLSHLIRADYAAVGYKMLSVLNPQLNARLALRYTLYMLPLGPACWAAGLTDSWFLLDSTLLSLFFVYRAIPFARKPHPSTARPLFLFSLAHLPLFMILMGLHRLSPEERAEAQRRLLALL